MVDALVPGASQETLVAGYHELDYIELRLKRANDNDTLRGVCVSMNRFQSDQLGSASPGAKARYSMLRGVLYAKGAFKSPTGWLGNSSVECMYYALDQFAYAEELLGNTADDELGGLLPDFLLRLRQTNAYEAAVVVTRLQVWGESLSKLKITPSTGSLSRREQDKIQKALSRRFMLTSRF